MSRSGTTIALILCIMLAGCAPKTTASKTPPVSTPQVQLAPLAPSLMPTATIADGTVIFKTYQPSFGLTFINDSGKPVSLRPETFSALMKMLGYIPNQGFPVEIIIVPEQATTIVVTMEALPSHMVTRIYVSAENEFLLNAGVIGGLGLVKSPPVDPDYVTVYGYRGEDFGILQASLLQKMTYEEYVNWALDHQRIPIVGDTNVSMETKWAQFQQELADAGVETLPLFIP